MKVIRVYTGADKHAHLQDVDLGFQAQGNAKVSGKMPAAAGSPWVRIAHGTGKEYHAAPQRQYFVLLEGSLEIICANGTRQVVTAGDILQLEDTEGHGHILQLTGCDRYTALFIPMA